MAINKNSGLTITHGSTSVQFDKANTSITAERIANSYKNIAGATRDKLKGYIYKAEMTIYCTDGVNDAEPLNKLFNILYKTNDYSPLTIAFADGVTFVFHCLSSSITMTDYLSNNSKLGLKVQVNLTASVIDDKLKEWS